MNPKTKAYWIIDYRIYDIERDGKTKLDHLLDMLHNTHFAKHIPFRTVLIDSWYASMRVMKAIQSLSKFYYALLKRNRLVTDSDGVEPHQRVDELCWRETEMKQGTVCTSKSFLNESLC